MLFFNFILMPDGGDHWDDAKGRDDDHPDGDAPAAGAIEDRACAFPGLNWT